MHKASFELVVSDYWGKQVANNWFQKKPLTNPLIRKTRLKTELQAFLGDINMYLFVKRLLITIDDWLLVNIFFINRLVVLFSPTNPGRSLVDQVCIQFTDNAVLATNEWVNQQQCNMWKYSGLLKWPKSPHRLELKFKWIKN